MTRFVAALLVAAGRGIKTKVSEDTPGAGEVAPFQPSALAAVRARKQCADERLTSDLTDALAAVPVADAGHRIRLQDHQRGGRPCT